MAQQHRRRSAFALVLRDHDARDSSHSVAKTLVNTLLHTAFAGVQSLLRFGQKVAMGTQNQFLFQSE